MDWFSRKTSIAGIQISNWILVLAAVVVIWIIYTFIAH
jgi:hypothetical protein